MLESIRLLERADGLLTDFDEGLRNAMIEKVSVQLDKSMVCRRKNGIKTQTGSNCEA
jgi:hypothetical protein